MNGLCARQHRDEGRDFFARPSRVVIALVRNTSENWFCLLSVANVFPRTRACVYSGAQVSGDGRRVHVALMGIGRVPTAMGSEYRKTDCERVGVSRCGGGRSAMGGGSVGSGGYGTTRARRARVAAANLPPSSVPGPGVGRLRVGQPGEHGHRRRGHRRRRRDTEWMGGATGGASAGRGGAAGDAPGGRGGGGGAQTATCPTVPPQSGTNCTIGLNCYYEDCAGVGVTNATCVAGVSAPGGWSPPVRARPSFARTRQR